jgi:hypothetical protein
MLRGALMAFGAVAIAAAAALKKRVDGCARASGALSDRA